MLADGRLAGVPRPLALAAARGALDRAREEIRDGSDPGDLVGMSTVPEVVAARHMGLRCLAISCVTNIAAGILPEPIDAEHVLVVGAQAQDRLTALLAEVLPAF